MNSVLLDDNELRIAALVGCARMIASFDSWNRVPSAPNDWNVDICGAQAELAVAKALNLHWSASVNAGKAPDVGPFYVRSTHHQNGHLILRKSDSPDDISILVLYKLRPPSRRFWLPGWIVNGGGMIDQYWIEDRWEVPQSALHRMEDL